MTHLINNIHGVEVPNFSGIVIIDNQIRWYANFGVDNWIKLPPGKWQIIGLAHEVTEEVAKTIVEDCPYYAKLWKHYHPTSSFINAGSIFDPNISCWTAKESLSSLLHSKGLNGNVLLLKKID